MAHGTPSFGATCDGIGIERFHIVNSRRETKTFINVDSWRNNRDVNAKDEHAPYIANCVCVKLLSESFGSNLLTRPVTNESRAARVSGIYAHCTGWAQSDARYVHETVIHRTVRCSFLTRDSGVVLLRTIVVWQFNTAESLYKQLRIFPLRCMEFLEQTIIYISILESDNVRQVQNSIEFYGISMEINFMLKIQNYKEKRIISANVKFMMYLYYFMLS